MSQHANAITIGSDSEDDLMIIESASAPPAARPTASTGTSRINNANANGDTTSNDDLEITNVVQVRPPPQGRRTVIFHTPDGSMVIRGDESVRERRSFENQNVVRQPSRSAHHRPLRAGSRYHSLNRRNNNSNNNNNNNNTRSNLPTGRPIAVTPNARRRQEDEDYWNRYHSHIEREYPGWGGDGYSGGGDDDFVDEGEDEDEDEDDPDYNGYFGDYENEALARNLFDSFSREILLNLGRAGHLSVRSASGNGEIPENVMQMIEQTERNDFDLKQKSNLNATYKIENSLLAKATRVRTPFTVSIEEDEEYVCLLCGVVLGVGIPDSFKRDDSPLEQLQEKSDVQAPYQAVKLVTDADRDFSKRIFIARCGHTYCGRCVRNITSVREVLKQSKKKVKKNEKSITNPFIYAPLKCVGDECKAPFRAKIPFNEIFP
jgi:hypothetical protein